MVKKFILSILTVCLLSCGKKDPDYDVAIHNVNIIDLKTGKIKLKQSVFIKSDTIFSIVDTKDIFMAISGKSINGTDQYLVPGFWDNYVRFSGGDSLIAENKHFLDLYIASGITTVCNSGGDLNSFVQNWQKEISEGKLLGPTIYTSGPKIDGVKTPFAGSLEVSNTETINAALDSLQQLNSDFINIYDSTISDKNFLKTLQNAQKRDLITSGHIPFSLTLNQTIHAGIDAIQNLDFILKECSKINHRITASVKNGNLSRRSSSSQLVETYSDIIANEKFKNLITENVYVIPSLHQNHTLSLLSENDHSNDIYLIHNYIGRGIQKTYSGEINRALKETPLFIKKQKKLDSTLIRLVGKLNLAGVKLLAGSDSGAYNAYIYPGISLHQELKALVDAGLTPLEALQTSSQNGANFLNKELPDIKVGAKADLVILDKNPLENIENTQEIKWILKSGKVFNRIDQASLKSN